MIFVVPTQDAAYVQIKHSPEVQVWAANCFDGDRETTTCSVHGPYMQVRLSAPCTMPTFELTISTRRSSDLSVIKNECVYRGYMPMVLNPKPLPEG